MTEINGYINNKIDRDNKEKEKNNYYFGLSFGLIITLITFAIIVCYDSKHDKILVPLGIFGVIIILMAIIYPNSLSILRKIFSFIGNLLVKVLFSIVLTIIYFILVTPVGIFIRKKQHHSTINSNFIDYSYNDNVINIDKHSFIYQIIRVFKFFFNEQYIVFMPVLIVLVLVAILLIFVQSNAIAPFIYTLF